MKKVSFLLIACCFTMIVKSQVYEIQVRNIQIFEHPIMSTNQAIREKKFNSIDGGTTDVKHVFDLNKMILYRTIEKRTVALDIISKKIEDNLIFNVMVKFGENDFGNFTYQKDDENKTLYCRWVENEKIVGWLDRTLK
jgi:hypothetical protein